jgi:hypothetical protein
MSALSALSALSTFRKNKSKSKPSTRTTLSQPSRRLVGFSVQPFLGDGAFKNNSAIKLLAFVNADNQKLACWYPRKQSASEFCKVNNIRGDPKTPNIFTGDKPIVTIHFPMKSEAFVVKTVRLQGVASYTRVLETVETHLKDAVKFWTQQEAATRTATTRSSESHAASYLDGFVTCHLMVSRGGGYNKIYVRTQM